MLTEGELHCRLDRQEDMRITGVGRGGRCVLGVTRRMGLGLGVEAAAEQGQHSREGYLASFWQAGR